MNPLITSDPLVQQIIEAGQFLYAQGWSPATSSNYSHRIDQAQALLTVSGKHKGRLTAEDVLRVNWQGESLEPGKKPSAETLLHTQLYQHFPEIQAVLHTHSVNATVISRLETSAQLVLQGYELQKALQGFNSHEPEVVLPIFDNTQDIPALVCQVQQWLETAPVCPGYLIRGHGLYTWGHTMAEALRHIEAFEFLFTCELKLRGLWAK